MSLKAILVTGGLFTGLSVMLLIAQRYLVISKPCTISFGGEEDSFTTQGGVSNLLDVLTEYGMSIPAACGGKGMCGYCKVRVISGGGPVLPTELPFLSRTEVRSNVRLSCQVKVKEDMEIQVPDFLETVRDMVKNKTFDATTRWRFSKNPQVAALMEEPIVTEFNHDSQKKMDGIVEELKDMPGAVVPMLQRVTDEFNHIPEPAMRAIAHALELPVPSVFRIATFYHAFSLTPKGKHTISVCTGTACHVKGAGKILEALERELGIKSGETTDDLLFSLAPVRCIGCCGLAPVVTVGEDVHGQMTLDKISKMLDQYRKEPADAQAAS